ncbi:MAG: hypothetical protein EBY56_06460 [Actinobacteria bacterium]|nr:hypothetical protein [Actinomycetota bacterium]
MVFETVSPGLPYFLFGMKDTYSVYWPVGLRLANFQRIFALPFLLVFFTLLLATIISPLGVVLVKTKATRPLYRGSTIAR